jgi:hypothetical protein
MMSFGALVAMMIASSGDESFVMLAMIPEQALILFIVLFIIAIMTGIITDQVYDKVHKSYCDKQEHDDCISVPECSEGFLVHEETEHNHKITRHYGWKRIVMLLGLAVFIAALASGQLGHDHSAHTGDGHSGHVHTEACEHGHIHTENCDKLRRQHFPDPDLSQFHTAVHFQEEANHQRMQSDQNDVTAHRKQDAQITIPRKPHICKVSGLQQHQNCRSPETNDSFVLLSFFHTKILPHLLPNLQFLLFDFVGQQILVEILQFR